MFQAIILGIIQGLTEFLPISSTAHLILAPWIFGWNDPGLAFDVVLHLGTLTGIIIYFRKDFYGISQGMISGMTERKSHTGIEGMIGWYIIIGTIPAGLAGFFFKDQIETVLRNPRIIALSLILFGLILLWAEAVGKKKRRMDQLNIVDAIVIGFAQAVALIPGVSRSGITITAGLFRNLERATAARFAFLLSTPIIMAGGLLSAMDVYKEGLPQDMFWPYVGGFAASAVSGFLAIKYLLLFLSKQKVNIF
ncbi:MAG TPA: undecaprenyl-diphosphatase UppP, partial [Candidatus Brocadiales bacterium]|nr:undecaprenyl-diphosphatase UppP [Candidatus Brocadiales bacterium]